MKFRFRYPAFTTRGTTGRQYDAEFAVIFDRENGNRTNLAIREVIGIATERHLIPRLATRGGTAPVFLGMADFRKGGFVRVPYISDYNFDNGYRDAD
jgi:hypothetical protein